jgi:hypothetical protein
MLEMLPASKNMLAPLDEYLRLNLRCLRNLLLMSNLRLIVSLLIFTGELHTIYWS